MRPHTTPSLHQVHETPRAAPLNGSALYDSSFTSPVSPASTGRKRKSSNPAAPLNESPGSYIDDLDDEQDHKKRQAGVKRACNECRQQKLRCDVQQDPWQACSRCVKQKLVCKIDNDFKRIGKRSRHAELERENSLLVQEIQALKQELATRSSSSAGLPAIFTPPSNPPNVSTSAMYAGLSNGPDQYMGSHEAVASLLELRFEQSAGMKGASPRSRQLRCLEDVVLAPDRVRELFNEYFSNYHAFLPLLDPDKSPERYFELSELLFWTIITIAARRFRADDNLLHKLTEPYTRLVWSTVSKVPQNYHHVKALCLLCTWPLPCSSTARDPTFQFSGVMMKVAMQIGLHRPSHPEDFSRSRVQLREEDVRDRLTTWATCNIIAQNVSTGYGQPSETLYDATLSSESLGRIPAELRVRLELENFTDKVTKLLYSNKGGPSFEESDLWYASGIVNILDQDLTNLARKLLVTDDELNNLYVRAIRLHLRLYAFFQSSSSSNNFRGMLYDVYSVSKDFLRCAERYQKSASAGLQFAPNYIMQMMLAAAYTLHRILNSSLAARIEHEDGGRQLFVSAIHAIRGMRVIQNDLPQRLAEVLVQLWIAGGAGRSGTTPVTDHPSLDAALADPSLKLQVSCRMSMSVVYDSVWRWREEWQGKVRPENMEEAVKNPTSPEPAVPQQQQQSMLTVSSSTIPAASEAKTTPSLNDPYMGLASLQALPGETTFVDSSDFFDSMPWASDIVLDMGDQSLFGIVPGGGMAGF